MKKLLPLLLLILGSGLGGTAGYVLRPEATELIAPQLEGKTEPHVQPLKNGSDTGQSDDDVEYVKLSNQFVVPVVKKGDVISLVVLALSLEVATGHKEVTFRKEPKIRDSFLQVLFDHANIGGFDGEFTDVVMLDRLRGALREIAQRDVGESVVKDVLIIEIARQDY